jgi:hypothetical protein
MFSGDLLLRSLVRDKIRVSLPRRGMISVFTTLSSRPSVSPELLCSKTGAAKVAHLTGALLNDKRPSGCGQSAGWVARAGLCIRRIPARVGHGGAPL